MNQKEHQSQSRTSTAPAARYTKSGWNRNPDRSSRFVAVREKKEEDGDRDGDGDGEGEEEKGEEEDGG